MYIHYTVYICSPVSRLFSVLYSPCFDGRAFGGYGIGNTTSPSMPTFGNEGFYTSVNTYAIVTYPGVMLGMLPERNVHCTQGIHYACIMYILYISYMYNVHFTLYSVHCTVYTVQCTL